MSADLLRIDSLIEMGSKEQAKQLLENQVDYYKSRKQYDSLLPFISYVGNHLLYGHADSAVQNCASLVDFISGVDQSELVLKAHLALCKVYYESALYNDVLRTVETANHRLQSISPTPHPQVLFELKIYKGSGLTMTREFIKAREVLNEALAFVDRNPTLSSDVISQGSFSLAVLMWYKGEIDSAQYYMQESLRQFEHSDTTESNYYYQLARRKSNLAAIYSETGRKRDAQKLNVQANQDIRTFISRSKSLSKIRDGQHLQLNILENLQAIFFHYRQFEKCKQMLAYTLSAKEKLLEPGNPEIDHSRLLLCFPLLESGDYIQAKELSDIVLANIESNPEKYSAHYLFVALGLNAKSNLHLGNYDEAYSNYLKAWHACQTKNVVLRDGIVEILLDLSNFMAANGEKDLVDQISEHTDRLIPRMNGQDVTIAKILSNESKNYYELKEYRTAKAKAQKALDFITPLFHTIQSKDAIPLRISDIKARLIISQSNYFQGKQQSIESLNATLDDLLHTINLLDSVSHDLQSGNDLSNLMEVHKELFDFSKKISLEIYERTASIDVLRKILGIHEAGIYARIRARLGFQSNSQTESHKVDSLETKLDAALSHFDLKLDQGQKSLLMGLESNLFQGELWDANLLQGLNDSNSSIVRFLYIDGALYAYLISAHDERLIALKEGNELDKLLMGMSFTDHSLESYSRQLNSLYRMVWKPIEPHLTGVNVIIIPDGPLFNMPFDLLCEEPVHRWSDLANVSLLGRYNLSYNYSILQVGQDDEQHVLNSQMVSYTPEFSDQMKEEYLIQLKDSVDLDQTYLHLLPQPLVKDEMDKMARRYKGKSFVNSGATKPIFLNTARENKIIHIGTHAECNNISPELSRLIFAKETDSPESIDDNSVYSYEIYDYDFTSDLAILTACETGKPVYQPGEGMISLAHAFNYAGSQSILTSLWEIDEGSSTEIVGYFIDHLAEHRPKDEALRLAKLDYLRNNEGKLLHPQYWSGLVLFGSTTPIELKASNPNLYLIILLVALLLFAIAKYYHQTSKRDSKKLF